MVYFLNINLAKSRLVNLGLLKSVLTTPLLILSGCSSAPQAPEIHIAVPEIEKPSSCKIFPDPLPINTRPVVWKVITKDTVPKNDEWVYFALDPKNYENLALTQADITRWIQEAMWRLNKYTEQSDGDKND